MTRSILWIMTICTVFYVMPSYGYSDDKKEVIELYEDGTTKIKYSVDKKGLRHGTYAEYLKNGKVSVRAQYKKGKLHGSYNIYFPYGKNKVSFVVQGWAQGWAQGWRLVYK